MENLIPALVRSWVEKGVRIINKRKRTQRKSGLSMTTWLVGGAVKRQGSVLMSYSKTMFIRDVPDYKI